MRKTIWIFKFNSYTLYTDKKGVIMILKCNDCDKEIETKDGVFLFGVFYCKECYKEYNSGIIGQYPIPVSGEYTKEELMFMIKDGSFITIETGKDEAVILRSIQSDEDMELYFRLNKDDGKLTIEEKKKINAGKVHFWKREDLELQKEEK